MIMPVYKNPKTGKTVHGTYGTGKKKQAASLKKKGYTPVKKKKKSS
tara:strand:+ start:1980 stop:2117 length:138 start_codon:yes stop_codon:yes gene_type:complete